MRLLIRVLAAVSLAAMACISMADKALVVAVQEYAPLISASTLRGCVNDATAIADVLKSNKFDVTMLTNEKATRKGILDTLATYVKASKEGERFVFYFAGHGRRLPHPALMPHDATSEGNDVTTDDLNAVISKIPARSRTVILDACFSGGMAAGEMARGMESSDLTGRFYEDPVIAARSLDFGPVKEKVNKQDAAPVSKEASNICYYTACTSNEQALEGTFDGQRHGLFTYALINNLKDDSKPWSDIHSGVKSQMATKLENTGRQQNPLVSKDYMNAHALDNDVSKPVAPQPTKTLIDVWNLENPDPKKVALELDPNSSIYEVGRNLKMTATVGQEGYLVILGQVDGHYYQFYPSGKFTTSDAHVQPGKTQFPGEGNVLFFDSFGANQVKAILFSDESKAAKLLDAMRELNGSADINNKDLIMTRSLNEPEFTSRLTMAVSDNLIGGSRFKDLPGFIKKVAAQDTPLTRYIWSLMKRVATAPKHRAWMENTDFNRDIDLRSREIFVSLINRVVQAIPIYDEDQFKGVKLSKATSDMLKRKPKAGDEFLRFQRLLLIDAFPAYVNADSSDGSK